MASVTLNLKNWSFIDFNEFNAAFKENDVPKALRLARKVIVAWDYPADLNSDNPFKTLKMGQPFEIIRTIIANVNEVIESGDESDVEVDLKWTWEELLEFQEASEKKQYRRVERMLHDVAKLGDTTPDRELTFAEGSMMVKAFNRAYERLITGKN